MNKFNLLFEQIIKEIQIPIDSFQFDFSADDLGNIFCQFDALNNESKLEHIFIKIFKANDKKQIIVEKDGNKETISEKQFLLKYYTYYERFNKALKQFETELLKDITFNKKQKSQIISDVEIIPFEDKLQDLTQQTKTFNVDGMSFEIKYKSGFNSERTAQINFGFIYTNEQNISSKLDAVVIVRINKDNKKQITKIRLTEFGINSYITETLFKNKYTKVFETLIKVVNLL